MVSFPLDGVEVQIAYVTHAVLQSLLDIVLLQHNPDTPLHKLCEGMAKAEPLTGAARLAAIQARIATFPPQLAQAMVTHWLKTPGVTPWRSVAQIAHRDAALWGRELLVEGAWRQLGVLAGLNWRYFTRFQLKRMHELAASMALAPPRLADRIEGLLQAPLPQASAEMLPPEGDVLDLVARHMPEIDLSAARRACAGAVLPQPG